MEGLIIGKIHPTIDLFDSRQIAGQCHRPKYCGEFVRVIINSSRWTEIGVPAFPRWVVVMNRTTSPSVRDEAATGIGLKSGALVLITTPCAMDVVHAASRVSFSLRKSKT